MCPTFYIYLTYLISFNFKTLYNDVLLLYLNFTSLRQCANIKQTVEPGFEPSPAPKPTCLVFELPTHQKSN